MKKIKTMCSALAVLMAVGAASQAQMPVSPAAGSVPITLKGNSKFTFVGVPFTHDAPVLRDVVAGISGNVLSATSPLNSGTWSSSNPASVIVMTGSNRGVTRRISSNTATTITLDSTITGLVNGVDEYVVVTDWTVGRLFGTIHTSGTLATGIKGGADSTTADIVYIANTSGNLIQLFYNTTANAWNVVGSGANQNNARLGGLNGGCLVKRAAGTADLTFIVNGVVRSGRQVIPLVAGATGGRYTFATYTAPANTTFGNSGLQGILVGGANASAADEVLIANASGNLVTLYYNTTNNRWQTSTSSSNVNGTVIAKQTALLIKRKSGAASTWSIDETFVP